MFRLHEALPGLRPNDAVGDSLQGETLGSGPVDGSMPFGCGGERDRTKRPVMGQVAARESDYAIITSDNPRGENPIAIIREIEEGIKSANYRIEVDRRKAIRLALTEAMEGDTVLIAGKGHETYQTIGTTVHPFDDRLVAKELLDELNAGRN